jgi:hypothetical protein
MKRKGKFNAIPERHFGVDGFDGVAIADGGARTLALSGGLALS